MDFPGLNLTELNNNELLKRLTDLNERIVFVYAMGNNQLLEQLQYMAEVIQWEIAHRADKKMWEANIEAYKPIVTDDGDKISTDEKVEKKVNKPAPNIFIPKRSKTPTSE